MKLFKPRGYAVRTRVGYAGLGEANILWNDRLSIFDTRVEAEQAIRRTLAYGKLLGYTWDWYENAVIEKVGS